MRGKFELWEIKFLGYLRLKKLDAILTPLAEDANEEARAADATKNADASFVMNVESPVTNKPNVAS